MITKFRSIAVIALLATAVLSYSSCQKDNKTTTTKDNSLAIATQIATNFYKSIGNTIASQTTTGLPTTTGVRNGKKVNDLTCGELIEVPYNNVYTKGDSVKDVMIGTNKYVVSCDGTQPNGYTYAGSYVNTGFSPYSTYDNSVDEYYTLKALLPGFAKMQVDGNQVSVYKFTTKKDGEYMEQHNSYALSGLTIDASSRPFDITAGTATFSSNGTNAGRNFSYNGTITFLGNHKAKVAFDGKVFDIEIL
ncbi:hypothetical protein EWM62_06265 [Mucilaginibacter terrigena]|uniref:Uncharacterized protein n=1 Tax=Mucilaginibacter terrigena TaxID=2492395 RepID=A0A4V1ZC61_9SPHI|nr:hypothetical protein [Mucilaginibacter terrigena]RYU91540.1 hypothetical protein EWM62_06265 [Mucilaginibacter terrigena]